MSKADPLAPLLAAIDSLVSWLKSGDYRGMLIGGVAASMLGRPRVTRDVDALVLVEPSQWAAFEAAGRRFGFRPRISNPLQFARTARILLMRHHSSRIDTDISFGALPFEEEAVARARTRKFKGISVPLPAPEDLIIMKAVAHRPVDLSDITGILDSHPKLKSDRIRSWVGAFANALETPEMLVDLDNLLERARKRKKKN